MDPSSPAYYCLTPEEHVLIRASCTILSEESKQPHCFQFWGKIFGVQNDYFIVQSSTWNPYEQPVTQYSRDGRLWTPLPPVPDVLLRSNGYLAGPLTGDPVAPYNYSDYESNSKVSPTDPLLIQVREEDRLAYIVRAVDSEGILIPKGSYSMDASGHLGPSATYAGMSYEDCCNLENYSVFVALSKSQPRIDKRGRPIQVLRPLLAVAPQNLTDRAAWRFQEKIYENYVTLQNVNWPGLSFYHAIDGNAHGRLYLGRGYKEINVPFLLGTPGDDSVTVDVGFLPDYDFKRTPEEAERAAAALAAAAKAKKDALESEFLVSEGEQIDNAAVLSGEEALSETAATEPFSVSVDGESHDATSFDSDATDNTSGDVSATEPDTSDLESTG